jgi:hypothetical protein|tara:strand:+ start:111 stop:413 length:303 start_codon:yes stop_codon:yes gene_type:complete
MNIHFYLNNEEETPITSLYDLESNPFALNDIIHLDVEELYPVDYNKYKEDFRNKMIKSNEELEKTFRRKKVKLVKEGKYMKFKIIDTTRLTIEYHCDLID